MSVGRARVDFVCDHSQCGVMWTVITSNLSRVRTKLREDGWTVVGSKDYCPNHRPPPKKGK